MPARSMAPMLEVLAERDWLRQAAAGSGLVDYQEQCLVETRGSDARQGPPVMLDQLALGHLADE